MAKTIINDISFSIYTIIIGMIVFPVACSNEIPYGKTAFKQPFSLTLNWEALPPESNQPDNISFIFYSSSEKNIYKFNSQKNELKASLPSGTYKVLIFNDNVQGVQFRNMESYEKAEAFLGSQSKAENVMQAPDLLYGTSIDQFIVNKNQDITQEITPQKLVQNISFKIAVDKITEVKECSGTISGVSSALNLSKNAIVQEAPSCTTPITATHTGTAIIANVVVLGIQPKCEAQPDIQNIVKLNFTLHDGTTATAETDLTEKMQQTDNKDIEIEIESHIDPNGVITLTATVSVWEDGGNSYVEIH